MKGINQIKAIEHHGKQLFASNANIKYNQDDQSQELLK